VSSPQSLGCVAGGRSRPEVQQHLRPIVLWYRITRQGGCATGADWLQERIGVLRGEASQDHLLSKVL
jgi:hypothetical protein